MMTYHFEYPYLFIWCNNAKRAQLFGLRCRVLARGARNSRLVEFEGGQREIVSGNALRKSNDGQIPERAH